MYRVQADDDRLGFGDVISAHWLFDLYLRHDAVALKWEDRGERGRFWFENKAPSPERHPGNDGVLSHAGEALGSGNPRQAIILTDDCEMEALQTRKTTAGRILLAAIQHASPAGIEEAQKRNTYRRFPLPPDDGGRFGGGIVELQRIFSVSLPSLTNDSAGYERLASLDSEAQARLSQSLCAHVTRHGPIVVARETAKLAMLMSSSGDPEVVAEFKAKGSTRQPHDDHKAVAAAVTRGLSEAWMLEGRVLDEVSEAWERGDGAEASVAAVREQLRRVHDSIGEALQRLDGGTEAA